MSSRQNLQWLEMAKKLQAIAMTGLHFTRDEYDRERYGEVAELANRMLAELGSVPVQRIEALVSEFAQGYATPRVDVRGVVVRDQQILLVQERSDGLWTLPGGYADVGLSASQNVAKEIREEACLDVEVVRLIGIRHKSRHNYDPDVRDFYKLFYLCNAPADVVPAPGSETLAAQYFTLDALPALSTSRVIREDLELGLRYSTDDGLPPFFD